MGASSSLSFYLYYPTIRERRGQNGDSRILVWAQAGSTRLGLNWAAGAQERLGGGNGLDGRRLADGMVGVIFSRQPGEFGWNR